MKKTEKVADVKGQKRAAKSEDAFSSEEYFQKLDAYFRAANYLSAAQLYLLDNPLMRDHELCLADVKRKLVGHWGTVPGQNFVYAHCDRVINKFGLNMILLSGPGHGGNFFVANSYLEGTYSEFYPEISRDHDGMKKLCKQFSFPGGIGSHCVPETPGSIHEGGELGYSLAHGFGAVLDNPDLIATVIVGDGEAETGPLATSWHGNKFINPKTDGMVLPILHLNGYKISNPSLLSRLEKGELTSLFEGYGYDVHFVEGDEPLAMHKKMAKAMDECIEKIKQIQADFRENGKTERPKFPMIILKTPKGWTGVKELDGKQIEGTFRAHQIPVTVSDEESLKVLKSWLESYRPDELFDKNHRLKKEIADILPKGKHRISANPNANGGLLLKEIKTPKVEKYALNFEGHGTQTAQDMLVLGGYIRDLFALNPKNYRIFSPDEAMSNRLYKVFETQNRDFNAQILPSDEFLARDGRVMDSFLSEHFCEGLLEGYILTGRHGMFDSYEAFIRVVDSMVAQHAKWLKVCNEIEWRAPISSLNLVLTSNVWQQDHNGFTHQDPGFLGHLANKKADVVRIYLPPDANCLLSTFDHCTKSKNYVNAIVASKHPTAQWLSFEDAMQHCARGVSEWKWAGMNNTQKPDLVVASCGDTATIEALALVTLLKQFFPKLNVKFVNVVDLMKLDCTHPHGLTDAEYDALFTTDKPVIFNFHGYPQLIHQLTYNRHNKNLHVSGYQEEGTITTPFDMRVQNCADRYHLLAKCAKNLKISKKKNQEISGFVKTQLEKHASYIREFGVDMPEISGWKWQ